VFFSNEPAVAELDGSVLVGDADVGESARFERRQQFTTGIQADSPGTIMTTPPLGDIGSGQRLAWTFVRHGDERYLLIFSSDRVQNCELVVARGTPRGEEIDHSDSIWCGDKCLTGSRSACVKGLDTDRKLVLIPRLYAWQTVLGNP
jgi:hypothetical protein